MTIDLGDNGIDEWQTVTPRSKRAIRKDNVGERILERSWILDKLSTTLQPYSPYAIFLYGSYSQGRATAASDVDVMVVWKRKVPELCELTALRAKLMAALGKSVDLVAMLYSDRVAELDEYDDFIGNVYSDAIAVKGDREAIILSQKMYKV